MRADECQPDNPSKLQHVCSLTSISIPLTGATRDGIKDMPPSPFLVSPPRPPYHILVSICQVLKRRRVFSLGKFVGDGILLYSRVVHRPRPLPHHQQAGVFMGSRLHILWLRTADWEREEEGGGVIRLIFNA